MLLILTDILKEFEIIHQCGEKNFKQVRAEANVVIPEDIAKYYHLYPFLREPQLIHAYKAADIIISRAGSGSIFEIAALGKPAVLIPIKDSAQNHQIKNAYEYSKSGAAIVIEETNLTSHFFMKKINDLFSQPEEMEDMSKKAKRFSQPRAAEIIAEYLLEYLK